MSSHSPYSLSCHWLIYHPQYILFHVFNVFVSISVTSARYNWFDYLFIYFAVGICDKRVLRFLWSRNFTFIWSGDEIHVCHRGDPVSVPDQSVWDLWWLKDTGTGYSPSTSDFPCRYHSTITLYSSASWYHCYFKDERAKLARKL